MAKNTQKWKISQEQCSIWSGFFVHLSKMVISPYTAYSIHHVSLNAFSFSHYCFTQLNEVHHSYVWVKWVNLCSNWISFISVLNFSKQWVALQNLSQNSVKHLRWSVLQKKWLFLKTLYLKSLTWFWIYFWITLFVLLWFWEGYSGLLIVCQTDYSIYFKLRIFPWFRSHTWKYNVQANKRLTKVKEK